MIVLVLHMSSSNIFSSFFTFSGYDFIIIPVHPHNKDRFFFKLIVTSHDNKNFIYNNSIYKALYIY